MIEIENLVKAYHLGKSKIVALDEVSLRIEQGEMVVIMGPSGSGKSTLLHLLGCLDRPTSGSYRLEGVEVSKLSDNKLAEIRNKRIGFVFQTFNLLPRASALANVELPLVYSHIRHRREQGAAALDLVGMSHRTKHKPSELSGGEQQRVTIARAIVNNPAIILADEPTGNLDTRTSHEIITLFQHLNQRGITIVIVTHEEEIAERAQHIIRLRDGQIVSGS